MSKSTLLATLILALSYSIFFLFSPSSKSHYHKLFISTSFSSNASISQNLRTLTRRPHVAGTLANAEAAAFVHSIFITSSLKSNIITYPVSLTYPLHRSLVLTPNQSSEPITFKLEQEPIGDNPYADEVMPTFHGYAKSGNVSGPVVYANYGRVEDFVRLRDELGVDVNGSVVIYTDKRDYGGDEWFPVSRMMPPSGVQVGTVFNGLGDPTTPGWASVDGCERLSEEEVELSGDATLIPSLPISAEDGETILKTIGGGGDGDSRVGPGPGILNLSYIVSLQLEIIGNE